MAKVNGFWIDNIFQKDVSSGDGVTTVFATTQDIHSTNNIDVIVDGLIRTNYSVTLPRTVTFSTAPVLGQSILFKYIKKV